MAMACSANGAGPAASPARAGTTRTSPPAAARVPNTTERRDGFHAAPARGSVKGEDHGSNAIRFRFASQTNTASAPYFRHIHGFIAGQRSAIRPWGCPVTLSPNFVRREPRKRTDDRPVRRGAAGAAGTKEAIMDHRIAWPRPWGRVLSATAAAAALVAAATLLVAPAALAQPTRSRPPSRRSSRASRHRRRSRPRRASRS